ncbi:retinoic acid receptor responder protein 3-like [Durio zibethinus]|uniref:Retinoic acid receptor responder protein 3-like n=1 Tax=Durio zibethinus TaxID=66656 RepID=A0A6P5WWC5_DURZI|nr:retinoic acid receptor responder protein 3-like [Durio zibethinus]
MGLSLSSSSSSSTFFTEHVPIDPNPYWEPEPGDHIYSERSGGLYYHHGIYVGDDMVIHLMAPPIIYNRFSDPCQKCGYKRNFSSGVIKTCLRCFLDGHSLHVCEYRFSKPAHEVITMATDCLEWNYLFGPYNLLTNNCEHFAVFCKTGSKESDQVKTIFKKVLL